MSDEKKIKALRNAKVIIYVAIILIPFLFVAYFFLENDNLASKECGTVDEKPASTLCGNAPVIDKSSGLSLGDYNQGKTLFKRHCAVCHSEGGSKINRPGNERSS